MIDFPLRRGKQRRDAAPQIIRPGPAERRRGLLIGSARMWSINPEGSTEETAETYQRVKKAER